MSLFRSSLPVLLLSVASFAQVTFQQSSVPTGANPVQVIVGDVNHDGIPDLISLDQADKTVSVQLGNGDGTFRARNAYSVGGTPVGVSTADLQKDGKVDIVTVNQDTSTVSVLIGNGDGTFQPSHEIAVGTTPVAIVVGDFNGDGKTDIVTANAKFSTISILPGNGDGTFQPRITRTIGTQHPKMLVKGDFNGDGRLDLLYVDCCQGTDVDFDTLHVLFNVGNFKFRDVTSFNLSTTQGLTVAKVDGDAKDDLLATYQGCHTPCVGGVVYTSNGDGTFTTVGTLTIDEGSYQSPTRPVLVDLNGDGLKDAAVAVSCCGEGVPPDPPDDALLVWLRQPDGSFANIPQVISLGQTQRPLDVTTGDVDRNNKQDLVVALANSNTLEIFLNTTPSGNVGQCSAPTSPGVQICSPAATTTVNSPVHIVASATGTVSRTEVWIDGVKKYQVSASVVDTSLALATGTHRLTVQAIATNGTIYKSTVSVTVN